VHSYGVELDGDAALALQVQGIQDLVLHFALVERTGGLDQAVSQRALAVIYVRDDAKVTNMFQFHFGTPLEVAAPCADRAVRGLKLKGG
jgi:hypothetical protein